MTAEDYEVQLKKLSLQKIDKQKKIAVIKSQTTIIITDNKQIKLDLKNLKYASNSRDRYNVNSLYNSNCKKISRLINEREILLLDIQKLNVECKSLTSKTNRLNRRERDIAKKENTRANFNNEQKTWSFMKKYLKENHTDAWQDTVYAIQDFFQSEAK